MNFEPWILHQSSVAVNVKGYDSSMGFTLWANKPAPVDADVRLLKISSYDCSDFVHSLSTKYAKLAAFL